MTQHKTYTIDNKIDIHIQHFKDISKVLGDPKDTRIKTLTEIKLSAIILENQLPQISHIIKRVINYLISITEQNVKYLDEVTEMFIGALTIATLILDNHRRQKDNKLKELRNDFMRRYQHLQTALQIIRKVFTTLIYIDK